MIKIIVLYGNNLRVQRLTYMYVYTEMIYTWLIGLRSEIWANCFASSKILTKMNYRSKPRIQTFNIDTVLYRVVTNF